MGYAKYLGLRSQIDDEVQRLVLHANSADQKNIDASKRAIIEKFAALPFSGEVWEMFFINAFGLAQVKRKDGRPYATHPTRMAMLSYLYTRRDVAHEQAVAAILHDYLEETGGISVANIARLRCLIGDETIGMRSAIILSEPVIPYEKISSTESESRLKRVAYVIHTGDELKGESSAILANVSLLDKFDNLHDLGYLFRRRAAHADKVNPVEDKSDRAALRKMAQRVAFFQMVLQEIGPFADEVFRSLLRDAIDAHVRTYNLEDLCDEEFTRLQSIRARFAGIMREMIERYHKHIGKK